MVQTCIFPSCPPQRSGAPTAHGQGATPAPNPVERKRGLGKGTSPAHNPAERKESAMPRPGWGGETTESGKETHKDSAGCHLLVTIKSHSTVVDTQRLANIRGIHPVFVPYVCVCSVASHWETPENPFPAYRACILYHIVLPALSYRSSRCKLFKRGGREKSTLSVLLRKAHSTRPILAYNPSSSFLFTCPRRSEEFGGLEGPNSTSYKPF